MLRELWLVARLCAVAATISSIERYYKQHRTAKMILIIVAVVVVGELLALLWLASTVSSYKNFWTHAAKDSGELTYVALGDSAAQGIGATSPRRGYVGLIAERLQAQTGRKVRIVNVSKTGATMQDYLRDQAPQLGQFKADLVTIEIGANDVAGFSPDVFREDFKKVLVSLPDGAYVANMPLFNSRPGSTSKGKLASRIIERELVGYPKLHFVDLERQTADHQTIFGFAPDLFHPNNLSYKNWADAFWLEIKNEL